MADSDSDESKFGDLINQLIAEHRQGLGNEDQSDISISSVNTSDLSDYNESDFDLSDHDSSDEDQIKSTWSNVVTENTIEEFMGSPGPTKPLPLDAKPVDYFLQLFPETLFERIAYETNLYAQQKNHRNFTCVTKEEIKAYTGILLYMGVIQLPGYRHYWSKRPELRQEAISSIMAVNRYEQITRAFHLNDSTQNPTRDSPDHDKLHKVRPVLDNAKKLFPSHYRPHKNMAVGETMVKFKGKSSILQYIPSKQCRWGMKAWGIADSESSYLLNFDIYTGKEVAQDNNVPLGTRVVTQLVKPYYNKRHHVYFDNFFTSVSLMEYLLRKKTYSCGTVRLNRRGLPPEIKCANLYKSGEMVKMKKGKLMAVVWCEEQKNLSVLSTANSTGNIDFTRKGKKDRPDIVYPKPKAFQEYNANYNAVFKNDQLRSYYGIANKAKKWWKYLFWFVCDVSVINAYILYRDASGGPREKPICHREFHLDVAKGLVNGYSSRKRISLIDLLSPPPCKKKMHAPTKIETKRGQRNCVMCSQNNVRTPAGNKVQSSWQCIPCGVALCKDNGCFGKFHNYFQ